MYSKNQLCAMNRAELQQLFEQCQPVEAGELHGCYQGNAYALPPFEHVPRWLRKALTGFINFVNIFWRGKSLIDGRGHNLWLLLSERFGFAQYAYHIDTEGCLCLNYQQPENPDMLHGLHARLRRLDAKTLLGQVEISGKPRLFFTLSQP